MIDKLKRQNRQNLIIHALALVLFSFLGAYFLQHFILAAPSSYSVPSNILQCSADTSQKDEGKALSSWLSSLPSDATANFPSGGCYYTQSVVVVHDPASSGITINGNGTMLDRTVANDQTTLNISNYDPYMAIVQNNDINVNGLTVNGTYNDSTSFTVCTSIITTNCTNGGDLNEGHTGVFLEANDGVTLSNMTFNNVEGDCLSVMFPQTDLLPFNTSYPYDLNYNVVVTNSTFNGCGYDGLSLESACGASITDNRFNNMYEDGIDFEVDVYSTSFTPPKNNLPSTCNTATLLPGIKNNETPWDTAEDDVTIANNTWNNIQYGDFYTSQQGQYPGIEEYNVALTGNTLSGGGVDGQNGIKIDVKATPLNSTNPRSWFNGLTIADNTSCPSANQCLKTEDLSGGAVNNPDKPVGAAINISNVANLNINNNNVPIIDGYPPFSNTPYISGLILNGELDGRINGISPQAPIIENNAFTNGYSVVDTGASSNNATIVECGNTYWLKNSRNDGASCTSSLPPSTPTNVQATANSPTSVTVSWGASTPSSGTTLGGYYVLRGGTTVGTAKASAISFPDTSVSGNTTYSYTVEAFDNAIPPDVSSPSTPAKVTTPGIGGVTKPSTPNDFKASVNNSYDVTLSWKPSTDSGGPGLDGYYIIRDGNKYAQVKAPATIFFDKSAIKGDTYTYQVEAYDMDGNISSPSTTLTVLVEPSTVIILGKSPVPIPVITVTPNSKPTLCVPAGINVSGVSTVTFTLGSQSVTTAPGQLCTNGLSTAGLSTGIHAVDLTLNNQSGGTLASYQEQLKIKNSSWLSHSRYWLVTIILLVLLVLDIAWMYIRPNHKHHKSLLHQPSHTANNVPVPPTVVTPQHKKRESKEKE